MATVLRARPGAGLRHAPAGGQCFNGNLFQVAGLDCIANASPITGGLPINGNVVKRDLSFVEVYGKANVTVNDQFSWGGSVWYSQYRASPKLVRVGPAKPKPKKSPPKKSQLAAIPAHG